MPETTYKIDYIVPPDKFLRQLDQMEARLDKFLAKLDTGAVKLKAFGANMDGVKAARAALDGLEKELKDVAGAADKAEKELKDVGKNNATVTTLTARLEKLTAGLGAVTVAATGAGGALAGVGAGGGTISVSGAKAPATPGRGGIGAAGVMLGGMGAMAGRAAMRKSIGAVKEGLQGRIGFFADAADKSTEFREGLREYASLRGEVGPNDKIVREAVDFAKKAGVLPEEISPFLTNYEGSAANARAMGNLGGVVGKGGYTKQQQDALEAKLKVRGAQFATRTGLDAKTAGDLTGMVGSYRRIDSETDLAGQLGGMHYGLDQGRGEITPLARGELGQAGSAIASGRVSGLPELGAFIGVASVTSKTAASSGTTYGQMSRFLNETGAGNKDQEAFVKESGMGAAKGDFAKLKALRNYLAALKPPDVNSFLESKGYGNSTDRRSVIGMLGNVDVLEERIRKANEIAANGGDVMAKDAANQKEMSSTNRQAEVDEFASAIETGIAGERVRAAEAKARARMADPKQPGGQRLKSGVFGSIRDMIKGGIAMGALSGEDIRVGVEANQALERGGKAVGVDAGPRAHPELYLFTDPENRQRSFSALSDEIQSKGGDPFGGAPQDAARKHPHAADAHHNIRPPAPPNPPPPPPPGNAGQGFNPGRK